MVIHPRVWRHWPTTGLRAREEIEIAEARVAAKQAEIALATSRLKTEQDVLDYYADMVKRGLMAPRMKALASRTVEEAKALLAIKKADLVELSVRLARSRRAEQRGPTSALVDDGIAKRLDDIERRQFDISRRVDMLEDYLRTQLRNIGKPKPLQKSQ